jgi:MFS family permease
MGEVFKLPCTKYVLIGGFLRNFAGCIITYYLPVFFGKNFPEMKTTYSLVNAAILSGGGIIASLISGILADKLESKSYWSKGIICCIGQSLAVPFLCMAVLQNSNFWLSICSYAAYFLIGSTYVGPAITMMQNTAPTHLSGSVVSVYFFSITIAQTISPTLFGMLVTHFGAVTNPAMYGPLIAGFTILGFGLSIPCWFNAGKQYNLHML